MGSSPTISTNTYSIEPIMERSSILINSSSDDRMREINIEFQEQYKRVDRICKDMYFSQNVGISAYIQEMECTPYNDRRAVYDWDTIYKGLKHARWMRNQLAHDISVDSDFCERSDIEFIKNFYDSVLNGSDPLSRVNRAKQADAQKRVIKTQSTNEVTPQLEQVNKTPRLSIWKRLASKIKSLFS